MFVIISTPAFQGGRCAMRAVLAVVPFGTMFLSSIIYCCSECNL